MNYPLISEYVEAIRFAEDNFSTLTNLRPVMENGRPFMSSGNFAVVFKMEDIETGKLYAVKCFTREEEKRERSYRLISDELNGVDSPYLTSIKYLEKELFVDVSGSAESEFPVLLMDWVEGQTMDAYIRENNDDKWELERLCRNFCRMGAWLLEQPFAHGDLKPENMMVVAGAMPLLVDYDGMYVPAMKGEVARELGSPDYRHPLRTEKDFDEHIDDFPLASIALSLKAISLDPSLLTRYGASDRLLFSATDYADLSKCDALREITSLYSDPDLINIHSMFLLSYSQKSTLSVLSQLIMPKKAEKQIDESELLSTEVTDEDLAEAWEDEYGVLYSKDKKRLLECRNRKLAKYDVREGTRVICSYAFSECHNLASMILPDSLKLIGNGAFNRCLHLASIKLSNSLTTIGNYAFSNCSDLSSVILPDSLTIIGAMAFSHCFYLTSITLPKNLQEIKGNPFAFCNIQISNKSPYIRVENNLLIQNKTVICASGNPEAITIPNYITNIGDSAFVWRVNLVSAVLPDSLTSIGDEAFSGCRNLSSIELPDRLTTIGDEAFSGCHNLSSINLPDRLTTIGDEAFRGCKRLTSMTLPKNLREIKGNPIRNCDIHITNKSPYFVIENDLLIQSKAVICVIGNLKTITIPDHITHIGDGAFEGCKNLTSIKFPDNLISIGNFAFRWCTNLTSIELPNSLSSIGHIAFEGCKNLTSIKFPDNLISIGISAFRQCTNLTSIELPNNLSLIEPGAFLGCENLGKIYIVCTPNADKTSVLEKFKKQLPKELWDKIEIIEKK